MKFLPALLFVIAFPLAGQTPQVPHKMQFAGMTLTIRDDARKEIQKDVDALTQSPKHFNIKVERARTYFPLIEKVFSEEKLPDDFKYLVLQESALIPDAVSVSNAVGFWQFKDFTAVEMGLRVDKVVDERMNIVSASRAAARYLKKNNYYFNNWVYALQAYQMGAGGVMRIVDDSENGASHMTITSKTYWYVKKFIAHMIAFEESTKGAGEVQIATFESKGKQSTSFWAKELEIEEEQLRAYNRWIKGNNIPDDKVYVIAKPVINTNKNVTLSGLANVTPPSTENLAKGVKSTRASESKIRINGVSAIKALPDDKAKTLAERANVDLSSFLKYNDINSSDPIIPGEFYFVGKKRGRADQAYHKVTEQDNLWRISQQYGIQLRKLKKFNRLKSDRDVAPGTTLWLSSMKPKNGGGGELPKDVVEIDKGETFAWSLQTPEPVPVTDTKSIELPRTAQEEVIDPVVEKGGDRLEQKADPAPSVVERVIVEVPLTQQQAEKIEIHPDTHTVQPGETLYAISNRYKVSVMEIVTWNNLDLKDGIKPGQVLKMVGEKSSEPETEPIVTADQQEIIHIVKPSDTLYSVARKYGVTIKDLMEWNGKKDFSISQGEKLKIPVK